MCISPNSFDNQIKEDELGDACSTHGIDRKCIKKNIGLRTSEEENTWKTQA